MTALVRDLRFWTGIVAALAMAILPRVAGSYIIFIMALVLVYAIAAIGLTILMGTTGQIGLAHAGFFAIGAYGTALLMTKLGLSFWVALPIIAMGTASLGFLLGFPALRLSGFYLAVATLGFAVLIEQALTQFRGITGGGNGMVVPAATLFGARLSQDSIYYATLAVSIILAIAALNILRSRTGRAFIALRDSEAAASAIGIDIALYKMLAFATSAFYAAIGGALFGQLMAFLTPTQFSTWQMVIFLAMVIVGGVGSISGAFVGSAFFTIVPELLQGLQFWQRLVFGLIIMLTIAFIPGGAVSVPGRIWQAVATTRRASLPAGDKTVEDSASSQV